MASSAPATGPPIKKGWLKKQGRNRTGLVRNWKLRYFVLENGKISYFENKLALNLPPYGENLKGEMSLVNAHVVEPKKDSDKTRRRILITGFGAEKDLLLEVENAKDTKDWLDALRQHCRFASLKDKTAFTRSASEVPGVSSSLDERTMIRSSLRMEAITEPVLTRNPSIMDSAQVSAVLADNNFSQDLIVPTPWFVMKVLRVDTRGKVFINVGEHEKVPLTSAVRGTNKWPFVISCAGRELLDDKVDPESGSLNSVAVMIYDVAVNSQIAAICLKDPQAKEEVCAKIIRHIKKYYKENIEDDYKTPKIVKRYKGDQVALALNGAPTHQAFLSGTTNQYRNMQAVNLGKSSKPTHPPSAAGGVTGRGTLDAEDVSDSPRNSSGKGQGWQEPRRGEAAPRSAPRNIPHVNLKKRYIPYEIARASGAVVKVTPEKHSQGIVLGQGEKVFVFRRQTLEDGTVWLQSTRGWIPERLQGSSSKILVPCHHGQPVALKVTTTRFVEKNVDKRPFVDWINSLMGQKSKSTEGCVADPMFQTMFMIDINYPDDAVIKIARTFNEIFQLRQSLLLPSTSRLLRDRANKVMFPSQLDGDEKLLLDVDSLIKFIDAVESWLNSIVRTINIDHSKHQPLVSFLNASAHDISLMEMELSVDGGMGGAWFSE